LTLSGTLELEFRSIHYEFDGLSPLPLCCMQQCVCRAVLKIGSLPGQTRHDYCADKLLTNVIFQHQQRTAHVSMRRDVNILSLQVEKSSLQMVNVMIKSLCEVFVMRNFDGNRINVFV